MEDWFYSDSKLRSTALSLLRGTSIPVINASDVQINTAQLSIVNLIASAEGSVTYTALYHGKLISAHVLSPASDEKDQVDLLIQMSILHKLKPYPHVAHLIGAGYLNEPQSSKPKIMILMENLREMAKPLVLHCKDSLPWEEKLLIAINLSSILQHLHQFNIAHRNLNINQVYLKAKPGPAHLIVTEKLVFISQESSNEPSVDESYEAQNIFGLGSILLLLMLKSNLWQELKDAQSAPRSNIRRGSSSFFLTNQFNGSPVRPSVEVGSVEWTKTQLSLLQDHKQRSQVLVPDCPERLEALVYWCCEENSADRPAAVDVVNELQTMLNYLTGHRGMEGEEGQGAEGERKNELEDDISVPPPPPPVGDLVFDVSDDSEDDSTVVSFQSAVPPPPPIEEAKPTLNHDKYFDFMENDSDPPPPPPPPLSTTVSTDNPFDLFSQDETAQSVPYYSSTHPVQSNNHTTSTITTDSRLALEFDILTIRRSVSQVNQIDSDDSVESTEDHGERIVEKGEGEGEEERAKGENEEGEQEKGENNNNLNSVTVDTTIDSDDESVPEHGEEREEKGEETDSTLLQVEVEESTPSFPPASTQRHSVFVDYSVYSEDSLPSNEQSSMNNPMHGESMEDSNLPHSTSSTPTCPSPSLPSFPSIPWLYSHLHLSSANPLSHKKRHGKREQSVEKSILSLLSSTKHLLVTLSLSLDRKIDTIEQTVSSALSPPLVFTAEQERGCKVEIEDIRSYLQVIETQVGYIARGLGTEREVGDEEEERREESREEKERGEGERGKGEVEKGGEEVEGIEREKERVEGEGVEEESEEGEEEAAAGESEEESEGEGEGAVEEGKREESLLYTPSAEVYEVETIYPPLRERGEEEQSVGESTSALTVDPLDPTLSTLSFTLSPLCTAEESEREREEEGEGENALGGERETKGKGEEEGEKGKGANSLLLFNYIKEITERELAQSGAGKNVEKGKERVVSTPVEYIGGVDYEQRERLGEYVMMEKSEKERGTVEGKVESEVAIEIKGREEKGMEEREEEGDRRAPLSPVREVEGEEEGEKDTALTISDLEEPQSPSPASHSLSIPLAPSIPPILSNSLPASSLSPPGRPKKDSLAIADYFLSQIQQLDQIYSKASTTLLTSTTLYPPSTPPNPPTPSKPPSPPLPLLALTTSSPPVPPTHPTLPVPNPTSPPLKEALESFLSVISKCEAASQRAQLLLDSMNNTLSASTSAPSALPSPVAAPSASPRMFGRFDETVSKNSTGKTSRVNVQALIHALNNSPVKNSTSSNSTSIRHSKDQKAPRHTPAHRLNQSTSRFDNTTNSNSYADYGDSHSQSSTGYSTSSSNRGRKSRGRSRSPMKWKN